VAQPEPIPAIFKLIEARGPVAREEMQRTFNLGIGMVAVVAPEAFERASALLAAAGERVTPLGTVEAAADGAPAKVVYGEG
jgi:phosphoribosylformylglycinamidine cyclo-ligase